MAQPPQRPTEPQATSKAMISLEKADLGVVTQADAKVGSRVRLVITGTVRNISKGNTDDSQEGSNVGSLELDVNTIKMAANSDIADLFEEDLDG